MSISASAPWRKFYGDTPATLDYPDCSIYTLVAQSAAEHPNLTAYEFMGKKTSYAQFHQYIEAIARSFVALGVRSGDRFTICMPNSPQGVAAFYALNRIGAVPSMIHPMSAPEEIAFYLNNAQSTGILVLDQFYQKVDSVRNKVKKDLKIVVASVAHAMPFYMAMGYRLTEGRKTPKLPKSGFMGWKAFMAAGKGAELPEHQVKGADCAAILFSGGTTGTTKGIRLSNLNFNALGMQTIAASGCRGNIVGMKMLSVMPLFHGFGLGIGIHTALIGGATCLLLPRFSIKTYAQTLLKKKPNFIPGVPTLFEALLRADGMDKADLSFLVGMFSGGDTLPQELKRRVDHFLKRHNASIQIREGYGTTECVTASCLTPIDYARGGSIGVPFPDTYYKIVKPQTDVELDAGEEGEICISGPTVMMGYVDNPEETASTLRTHSDGKLWLHTGDLGSMDSDGFVYFHQRLKRMIISSGYNVYPTQIENIISSHEKVHLCCVIGVKDAYKMEKVKAFVVPTPGIAATDQLKEELMAFCRQRIARYALPYDIEFRDELPKTLVGKVDYRKLEAEEAE